MPLQASVDPAKVQFISIDDEDPSVVKLFLKRRPVFGWLGFDTTGKLPRAYGVNALPATIVIDPAGRVITTEASPKTLTKETLIRLTKTTSAQPSAQIQGENAPFMTMIQPAAPTTQSASPTAPPDEASTALIEIVLSKAHGDNSRSMFEGVGRYDLTNLSVSGLLHEALGIPEDRIAKPAEVLEQRFSLHVDAARADPSLLKSAVESSIAAGAGIRIEHHVATTKVLVLTAEAGRAVALKDPAATGFAVYQPKIETLTCLHASMDDISSALEQVLTVPIVNETGLPGRISLSMKLPSGDASAARKAFHEQLGLDLIESIRAIESLTLAPVANNP